MQKEKLFPPLSVLGSSSIAWPERTGWADEVTGVPSGAHVIELVVAVESWEIESILRPVSELYPMEIPKLQLDKF